MEKVEFIHGTPSLQEFEDMFGGWLTELDGKTFLIDCGVGSGGPSMVANLKARLGDRPLDYILLTHIHLDHAGRLGELVKAWPGVKIVTHGKGLPHLISPARLWASTNQVMGERVGAMYGQPVPMEPGRLIPHTEANILGLKIIETPGHAPHHLCFRLGQTLFAGESCGCPEVVGGRLYLSPATPPKFFMPEALNSVELLSQEPDGPAYFGHTHYPVPLYECLKMRKRQLAVWADFINSSEADPLAGESRSDYLARLTDEICKRDPDYAPQDNLSEANRWRHRYFTGNDLEGFLRAYRPELNGY